MGFADVYRGMTAIAVGITLSSSLALGGCASSNPASSLMDARAEMPTPAKTSAFLPVEDLPPPRAQAALTPAEQAKIKKELLAARDHQAAKAKGGAASTTPEKPQ
ncbi:MAG TPA: hypothetical protein VMU69_09455 [Bradyrhizobium sp.]|nr:hypothetical protein [Bradyrhizobium sp.]